MVKVQTNLSGSHDTRMSTPSLTYQLLTVAVVVLQRQMIHNNVGSRTQWNSSYDYIVVGAGTSGSLIAGRLTENASTTVLLIEAGGPASVITDMPIESWNIETGEFDWGYYTVPQANAGFAFRNRQMVYPRGKVMGGSHSTNFAIYNRGHRYDFDHWANYYGLSEWSFENVLQYFTRTENNTNSRYVEAAPGHHSTTGQVEVSSAPNPDPILLKYMEGWNHQGLPYTDFNGPHQLGTTLIQQTISTQNYTRLSTSNAFIVPAIGRNNLHVLVRSHCTRILLRNNTDTNQLEAYGIEFVRNNQTYQVQANHEVILAAGAINTPQIMMLSGIGPRQHLMELGIQVQMELPVGEQLQDHILIPVDYLVTNESLIQYDRDVNNVMTVQNLYNYYINNSGPITQLPVVLTYHSTRVNDVPDWPDGIMATLIDQIPVDTTALTQYAQDPDAWTEYLQPLAGDSRHFYVFYALYRPRSRGTVRLRSRNPFDAPLIDPNYYGDVHDLAVAVDTMSAGMEMMEQPFFRQYARIYPRPIPGCQFCPDRPYYKCYTYLACYAQTLTLTSYHPTCTCRMGNSSDTGACVDEHLRVLGVNNLRVIDASIMPKINNANTNAATMMIAERGVDFIRQDTMSRSL
ncbi:L-sorbose 1-dehydrogenase isoform X2 [Dermatophagoides farinae]|uniref:L-sorbose 1-dehydrogenase isoform X2 n=1 Tax=Dermatophagoides farinae TaxID=6954 RepID=UPI003F644245